jgi:ABC-type sugar transport system substrate-binding protein
MLDQNRPFCRVEIDRVFNRVKAAMHVTALVSGKSKGLTQAHYYDAYTGKELIGGDAYEYAHIRSSEEIHTRYKSILTDEEIALVVNCVENVAVTLTSINRAKGKKKMEDWLRNNDNIVTYGIDLKLALTKLKKADDGIERIVKWF